MSLMSRLMEERGVAGGAAAWHYYARKIGNSSRLVRDEECRSPLLLAGTSGLPRYYGGVLRVRLVRVRRIRETF